MNAGDLALIFRSLNNRERFGSRSGNTSDSGADRTRARRDRNRLFVACNPLDPAARG
jgi:hypothetical protein